MRKYWVRARPLSSLFRLFPLSAELLKQRVDDMLSSAREFVEGFPQGTVLGPLFWDLFCDDLYALVVEALL